MRTRYAVGIIVQQQRISAASVNVARVLLEKKACNSQSGTFTMTSIGQGLVTVEGNILVPAEARHGPVELFYATFDVTQFDAACFARHAIALPLNIARSVRKRQAEYFHGRLCARAAMASHGLTGTDIGTGLNREPLWPASFVGSITHSHNIAVAAVLPNHACNGIGIDIEEIVHGSGAAALTGIVLSKQELAYLRLLTGYLPLDTLLTLVFSAKESFYKGMFGKVRRFLDFDVIQIVEVDIGSGRMMFEVTQPITEQFIPGTTFAINYLLLGSERALTSFQW